MTDPLPLPSTGPRAARGRSDARPESPGRRRYSARALALLAGASLPVPAALATVGAPAPAGMHRVLRELELDSALAAGLLGLDPDRVGAHEVRTLLARIPAPRIIALHGSVPLVTMQPFADFLVAMGYPAERVRNPADGSSTYASFVDSARVAGMVAWHYEAEAMTPMLIGHSQGGMVVVRALHELAGRFERALAVWDPAKDEPESRFTILDPITGGERPVAGLQLGYAAALATGSLPRLLLGQWGMLPLLRDIPDSVRDFTGFAIPWDPIAGTGPDPAPFRATGNARVRNLTLPASTSHVRIPAMRHLAGQPETRDWIERYQPGNPLPAFSEAVDAENLLQAADIWWSVRRQWCLEAQRLVRVLRQSAPERRQG